MVRFLWVFVFALIGAGGAFCQTGSNGVNEAKLQHFLQVLSADSLKGRGNYTQELKNAAAFIQNSFRAAGLLPYFSGGSYLQFFSDRNFSLGDLAASDSGNYDPLQVLANVVGVLPGSERNGEVIIFSAHYDHMGTEAGGGDGIFNGANDNASGTAAMLALGQYFAAQGRNRRTLVFCAFAGEELGLLGSQQFAKLVDPKKVIAVINLEMLGRTGAAGANAFFMTGTRYSSLPDIFKKALDGHKVRLRKERYSQQGDLFMRSDNYPFAQLGIAAHTVMSSDDNDPCYHRPCDEWQSINGQHLLQVTNALIQATRTLVDGTERPVVYSIPR